MGNIRRAEEKDLERALSLLEEVDLPIDGVEDHFHNFVVGEEGGQLIGCAGIEIYDDKGLIRSVAVDPSFQGRGLGQKLVDSIHILAVEKKLKEIYLLTETAEKFFSKLNYIVIPREEADEKVKQSVEFISLCPASATCMVKTLR